MKRLLILSACLVLSACGNSAEVTCDPQYWDGTVGTCLPEGWDIIDQETLRQRGVPAETIVAFQKTESVSGQFPTVAITKEILPDPVSSENYSAASIRSVEVMEGYTLVDTQTISVEEEDASMHIFTAQPLVGEPRRRFYQVSVVRDDAGFTVTGVSPVSIDKDVEDAMMLIINNVVFTEPTKE